MTMLLMKKKIWITKIKNVRQDGLIKGGDASPPFIVDNFWITVNFTCVDM